MNKDGTINMPNRFRDPDMRCPQGHLIPRNGDPHMVNGKERVSLKPLLGCPECAIENSKKMPKPAKLRRLRQGEKDDRQVSFLSGHDGIVVR